VQILRGARNFDLVVVEAAEAVGDRRHAFAEHAGVRDHERVRLEPGFVRVHEFPEAHAANLLFAFDHDFQIQRQLPGRLQDRVQRANVDVNLAFVVGGAAAE
jgi:hypothetical protein